MPKEPLEELKHRVEMLEHAVRTVLQKVPEVRLTVEVPRVILEKKPVYVKVEEKEVHGRIILLALDGFLDEYRAASQVASELLRRGWAPKDFQYVRPTLEQLVSLRLLERVSGEGRRRAKWLYRKAQGIEERVVTAEEPKT